jgi:hypothetical protein
MAVHGVTRGVDRVSRARDRKFAASQQSKQGKKLIGVKGTHYLHRRMREACRADGLTSAELIESLLDMRDRDMLRRANGGNPLAC